MFIRNLAKTLCGRKKSDVEIEQEKEELEKGVKVPLIQPHNRGVYRSNNMFNLDPILHPTYESTTKQEPPRSCIIS